MRRTAILFDQHPLWLEAVQQVLTKIGVDVIGRATSPKGALTMVQERNPDVLVTELRASDGEMDGLSLLRRAREHAPGLKSIVLSMYDDAEHIKEAFEAGGVAYVVKTAHPDDLASAIRQVFDHSIYLAGDFPRPAYSTVEAVEAGGLTKRELEILRLVADGHSNAELARMLWVTEQTVKFHLSNVYRKLNVSNRTEASRWAQVHGLLGEPMHVTAA